MLQTKRDKEVQELVPICTCNNNRTIVLDNSPILQLWIMGSIDCRFSFYNRCSKDSLPQRFVEFVIDQLLHLGILIAISNIYEPAKELPLRMIDCLGSFSIPLLILAILLCMKPTNILIKLILEKYQVGESESCSNIKNAGALIGILERILAIAFVLLGQFEAIGFIVAAKSILRFKDTDTAKTEYVLAGTFLSFGIAILCGLMVRI